MYGESQRGNQSDSHVRRTIAPDFLTNFRQLTDICQTLKFTLTYSCLQNIMAQQYYNLSAFEAK
jgi:hypothetical protein